jgi:hypothetical protein
MPLFMYGYPNTGYRVQGFVAEDTSEDRHVYVSRWPVYANLMLYPDRLLWCC